MKKFLIDLIFIFCLVLSITLYFSPDSSNEMFGKDEALLCLRGGCTTSNSDECPKPLTYRGTRRYVAPQLPDLPPPTDNFSENSDSENELSWDKRKNNPDSWSQYQQDCQDQSKKGQTCDLVEIVSRIKEDTKLIDLAKKAGKNQAIQDEINLMIEKLRLGNENCGIGKKTLFRNVKELRGSDGGRVYYRKVDGKIEILAKSDKVKRNQQKVINILKDLY